MTPPPIDIRPADLAIVLKILDENLPPDVRVWVFGSRANWTTKDSSDLDLAINAGRPLTTAETGALAEAFEESDLPYRVDVVDMATVSDGFRAIIEANRVEVQPGGALPSPPIWGRSGVAGEWETAPLGDMVDPKRGISYGIVQPGKPVDSGIPIVRVANVREGRIDESNPLLVSPEIERSYGRTRLRGGELLITIVGTVGETAIVPDSLAGWNVARAIAVLPIKVEIGAYWVRLALGVQESVEMIHSRLNTTVQPTLNLGDLARLPIVVPPRTEREAISHILGTLDDKIEVNRKMAATLEAMARAIFNDSLDQASEERRLDSLCDIFDGPHATPDTVSDGPIFLGISNLTDGRLDLSATRHVTEDDFITWTRRVTPLAGDIVFSYETRLGAVARIPKGLRCCLGRRMGLLRPKMTHTSSAILLYAYLSPAFQDIIRARTVHGSTVDRIPLIEMGSFPIVVPTAETERRITPVLECLRERVEQAFTESCTLAALRDTLLPKLISGDLRVKDAERFLAERGPKKAVEAVL